MAQPKRHRNPPPAPPPAANAHRNRQVAWLTGGLLVLVSAYTVALGSNSWLWFGWAVLLLVCAALFVVRR